MRVSVFVCAAAIVSGCGSETQRQGPPVDFQVHETNPVLPTGAPGTWDAGLVDPGAMTFHAGQFHMLYNGIPSWPHPLSVGHATSEDGIAWVRQGSEPVFDHREVPFAGWGIRANSVVVEDGTWLLYFAAADEEGALRGRIGRAVSRAPDGPWSVDTVPALRPGPTGAWDAAAVGDAKVVPDADGYTMYFTGVDADGVRRIGRATSTDVVSWSKYDRPDTDDRASRVSDPVLKPGNRGLWDATGVSDPSVLRTPDGGWLMVFRSSAGQQTGLGLAFSADGITWRKSSSNPIVTNDSSTEWTTIYYSAVLATQQRQFIYFEARVEGGGTAVHVVTSETRRP